MTDSPMHDIPMEPGEDDLAFLRRVAASMPVPPAAPAAAPPVAPPAAAPDWDALAAAAGAAPSPAPVAAPSAADIVASASALPLNVPASAPPTMPPPGAPVAGAAFDAPPPAAASSLPAPPPVGAAPLSAPPPVGAAPLSAAPPAGAPVVAPPPFAGAASAAASVEPVVPLPPASARSDRSAVEWEQPTTVRHGDPKGDPELLACLHELVATRGSDLHVSKNAPPMVRIDGTLRPVQATGIWDADRVARALYSIVTPAQLAQFEEKQELDFAFPLTEQSRFRVNFYRQRGTIGAAFRLIPTEIKKLDQLGVPEVVGRFSTLPRGLVLVTGPTGSGKSTTLAALIDLVNETRADHIMTVEDPIEFVHKNKKSLVNQREVGADTHSFQNALKHVLRQDPDVILIGELRDLETISTALTAAETGHLVFATLHTQDAGQTIDRIIDVFPPFQQGQVRQQLAATLQGVVCQTLVKKASGQGRAVATEVLVATPAIANLIREGKTYQIGSAMQAGRGQGMHTMDQHLAELVNAGTITIGAAREKAHDHDTLQRLVTRQDGAAFDPAADFERMNAGGN
ncbi:type IV pilus twitching motility protein PilT [Microcella alkalica]|uniref:type IV pilus twitching motility protein PilT n=1 Tax=Microcella alkalica TaxID=355930 RepID=UPI00249EA63B|nr:type IV pilus twitching motility protein PilT [Microcella alkalica]